MTDFFKRVFLKLHRIFFFLQHRNFFRVLGKSSYMFSPFRVDGAEGIEIGDKTLLQRGGWLYCAGVEGVAANLKIGNGCVFGYNNHIASVRSVIIGDFVLTANNVYISDNLHGYEDVSLPIIKQPVKFKNAVSIGDGCWIGENVCIIGAKIGKNCVIGANAVVTHDIPDYSVAVGIPAIVIRQFDQNTQKWVTVNK